MTRLQTCVLKMLRRILHVRHEAHLTRQEILTLGGLASLRSRLAVDRLLHARQLFCHGPAFLHVLVHREAEALSNSWLSGLQHDLRWLQQMDPTFQLPIDDLTDLIDYWQTGDRGWLARVKKAWRFHVKQEQMMSVVQRLHQDVLQRLKKGGATFSREPWSLDGLQATFQCSSCEQTFSSNQGLAAHRRLKHGIHAPEFAYINGGDCPICMRHFWSSARLSQHLSYMPRDGSVNKCFAQLQTHYAPVVHQTCQIPMALKSATRLEALPLQGPLPAPTATQRQLQRDHLRSLMLGLEDELHGLQHGLQTASLDTLHASLSSATTEWLHMFRNHQCRTDVIPEPADLWLACMNEVDSDEHEFAAFAFMRWGQMVLPSLLEEVIDGEAEFILDDAFATLVQDLPCFQLESELQELRQRLLHLQGDPEPLPHRPVKQTPANAGERERFGQVVPRMLRDQPSWQAGMIGNAWEVSTYSQRMSLLRLPDERTGVIVLHLFSGFRRSSDFHAHLQRYLQDKNLEAFVLSLDTAVSPYYGDLRRTEPTWAKIQECFDHGLIAATLSGAPCETWSEARYQEGPPDSHWPRPLRTADRPYGIDGLTWGEYQQTQQGSEFYLQSMEALAGHICSGGFFVAEHPALPRAADRPSTWRTPLTRLLRQHPEIKLDTVGSGCGAQLRLSPLGSFIFDCRSCLR
eukprot:Skav206337  [mRNA]  locus=scaffold1420:477431:479494:- [translate_table: standard]